MQAARKSSKALAKFCIGALCATLMVTAHNKAGKLYAITDHPTISANEQFRAAYSSSSGPATTTTLTADWTDNGPKYNLLDENGDGNVIFTYTEKHLTLTPTETITLPMRGASVVLEAGSTKGLYTTALTYGYGEDNQLLDIVTATYSVEPDPTPVIDTGTLD